MIDFSYMNFINITGIQGFNTGLAVFYWKMGTFEKKKSINIIVKTFYIPSYTSGTSPGQTIGEKRLYLLT